MATHNHNEKEKESKAIKMPEYIVPAKGKSKDIECPQKAWAKNHLDNMHHYGSFYKRQQIEQLYQYAEARVDKSEFDHVTKIYSNDGSGIEKIIPAYIRDVNMSPSILNRLVGEANTQPIKYSVAAVNSDAVIAKLEKFVSEAAEKITKMVRQQSGLDKILGQKLYEEDDDEIILPENVEEMNFSNYRENDEIMMQDGLNYLMSKTSNSNLRYKLTNQNYRDYLICSEMASHVHSDIDDPNFKRIDPRDLGYVLSPNSPFIHHGQAAWYYFEETPQGIIDMFPDLPENDILNLQQMNTMFASGEIHAKNVSEKCGKMAFISESNGHKILLISGMYGQFRASKRLRVKINENKFDAENPHMHFVSDDDNNPNSKYENRYITEIWEGYKLGNNIYHRMRPLPGQNQIGDSPTEKDLTIIGIVDPNPSLIQLVQPIQSLRIQAFYNIERLMSQIQGNVLIIDEAIESDNENNIYNMRVNGIWKVNTAQEGDMQLGMGTKQSLKPEVKDMAGSQSIAQLMNFVTFLDSNVMMLTGINDARQGMVKSDAGLSVTQNANMASQMTTQPYLTTWYLICQITLQKLLEQMKSSWSGKEITRYFLGDSGFELLKVKPGNWDANVYGVFVENSANSDYLKNKVIAMAEKILPISADPDLALSIIKMINASNSNEAIRIFEKGVDVIKKLNEQNRQDQMNAQQQSMQMNTQLTQIRAKTESDKVQGGIQEATIAAQAKLEDTKMKLEHKGEAMDVNKQNRIDEKLAEFELNKASK